MRDEDKKEIQNLIREEIKNLVESVREEIVPGKMITRGKQINHTPETMVNYVLRIISEEIERKS